MSDKFDNGLNLALETPENIREKSDNLNLSFDEKTKTWEVIVKHNGLLTDLEEAGIKVEYLLGGYAILKVPEGELELVSNNPQIEYAELPRRFFYQQIGGQVDVKAETCFYALQAEAESLTGRQVLFAVLDSGIALKNPQFQKKDGTTRVRFLWDQDRGEEYTGEMLDELLVSGAEPLPGTDVTGHGTAVAGIGAGSLTGLAPDAELLIVKLGTVQGDGFPMTTQIMRGVDAVVRKALELGNPLVINLSFGNSYGPHDGTGLLATYLDTVSSMGRTVICVGMGNEGDTEGHSVVQVQGTHVVQLAVAEYEANLSIQLWQSYADKLDITLYSPGGARIPLTAPIGGGKYEAFAENTRVLVYLGTPTPYSVKQETYIELLPLSGNYINGGIWEFEITGRSVVSGRLDLYLPALESRGRNTRFLQPSPEVTLTIPATAQRVISVAGYNSVYQSFAPFSGRGYVGDSVLIPYSKPDIAAPAVDVPAPSIYGGMAAVTGTSFATPIVSGAAALLMEQGIVRDEDRYLYGEKMKALLQARARSLPGINVYPDAKVGWGKLCVF